MTNEQVIEHAVKLMNSPYFSEELVKANGNLVEAAMATAMRENECLQKFLSLPSKTKQAFLSA